MKTRIISAIVAIVLLTAVLCLHSTIVFNIALSLIGTLMVYEVVRAVGLKNNLLLLLPSLSVTLSVPILAKFYNGYIAYIAIAFIYIVICMSVTFKYHSETNFETIYLVMIQTVLISASMLSLAVIENECGSDSWKHLLLTFCGAWLADTGAYFVGTFLGKHKLCPEISPKKTVEGMLGGFASNALLFILLGYLFLTDGGKVPNYVLLALMGAICAFLGLMGDLCASLIKRKYGIKDYGNIMPGHGGAMDRFDSVVYVAPFMAFCLTQLAITA